MSSNVNSEGHLETQFSDNVLRIRIANSKRFNAMSLAMWEDLIHIVADANDDNDIRVVVLTGAGYKAFASGADISEMKNDPDHTARFDKATRRATQALSNCRHPTIAVIHGVCMGGGMSMAMACDLRYCTHRARFRMPAGRLGIGYDPEGIHHFANTLGIARTTDLFLTGRTFDGHEAARIGFIHEAFDDDLFDDIVGKRVHAIKQMAPLTLRAAKLALRQAANEAGAPDKAHVEAAYHACFTSHDFEEGRQAFMAKREPSFEGR
jgi:enoyl-CoA hydratase/carnithine racemase